MKRKFKVYSSCDGLGDKAEVHDYNIVVDYKKSGHKEFVLYKSDNSEWTVKHRGEECIRLVDDGNGVTFSSKLLKKEMDYLEVAEVFILLNFINKVDNEIYSGYYEEVVVSDKIEI